MNAKIYSDHKCKPSGKEVTRLIEDNMLKVKVLPEEVDTELLEAEGMTMLVLDPHLVSAETDSVNIKY